jgi:hypothetical protein
MRNRLTQLLIALWTLGDLATLAALTIVLWAAP